jgi:putative phosphoesterase
LLIGITGDTHNNLKNISKICEIFNSLHVDLVIHTGDVTLPKSLKAFKALKSKIVGVYGNNDQGEKKDLIKTATEFNCSFYEEPYYLKLNGISLCIIHHPELIDKKMLDSSDVIVHGHTHKYREETLEETLIFNPGECAGLLKGKNKVGLIRTENLKTEIVQF